MHPARQRARNAAASDLRSWAGGGELGLNGIAQLGQTCRFAQGERLVGALALDIERMQREQRAGSVPARAVQDQRATRGRSEHVAELARVVLGQLAFAGDRYRYKVEPQRLDGRRLIPTLGFGKETHDRPVAGVLGLPKVR